MATPDVTLSTSAEPTWTRGRVGMASLIVAETSFFAVFVVAYLFYLGKSTTGPQPEDVLSFPLTATIALLSSSATVVLATRSLARGERGGFMGGLLVTITLGAAFLYFTAAEWRELIEVHGLTIRTNLFGTTFYSLVGFHAAHVTAGLGMLSLIAVLGGLGKIQIGSEAHAQNIEMVAWYWHFVDAVWVVVLTVVYIVGMR